MECLGGLHSELDIGNNYHRGKNKREAMFKLEKCMLLKLKQLVELAVETKE